MLRVPSSALLLASKECLCQPAHVSTWLPAACPVLTACKAARCLHALHGMPACHAVPLALKGRDHLRYASPFQFQPESHLSKASTLCRLCRNLVCLEQCW